MVCSGYCGFIFFDISHRYLVSPNHVIFWVWWAVSELASVVLLSTPTHPLEHGGVAHLLLVISKVEGTAFPKPDLLSFAVRAQLPCGMAC